MERREDRLARSQSGPVVDRVEVDGQCPVCGAAELRTYPVLREGGWHQVTRCQECLHVTDRERGSLLGPVQLTSAGLIA